MKRQWKIRRDVQEYPNGQNRWDRAYLLVLEIARMAGTNQVQPKLEVQHASSNLCPSLDLETNPNSND